MRILRVISSMSPENGGPCQGIRNSVPAQEKLGVQNEVVCFDSPKSLFLTRDDIMIHAIGPCKGPYAYCSKFKAWLLENLERFDVVIIHGAWLYNSFGSFMIWSKYKRKNKRIPKMYLMPHGMLDPYFQKAKDRRIKALRNLVFWHLFEHRVVNGIDGLLFTCEQELRLARKTFSSYRPKTELNIGYGIQPPPIYRKEYNLEFLNKCPEVRGRDFILFLSRVHPKKGVDLLVRAYMKIKRDFSDFPDLVIAGPGMDSDFGKGIKAMAGDASVHFPGMLEGDAKWGAFHGCDAFILPSHQENFGIAVVEALACKKAVLITDQVNIWREIYNGSGGLISKDTEIGIYEMLEEWQNYPQEAKKAFGSNGYKIFMNHFSVEKAALKLKDVLS